MTTTRIAIALASACGVALSKRHVLMIAFGLCAGLSAVLVAAIVHGFAIGEHVGMQVYAVLAMTIMGAAMWGSLLKTKKADV